MKIRLEKALHIGAAAVTIAAAFGLDPIISALLLGLISVGLAILAGLPN